jgi:hypothetical protein
MSGQRGLEEARGEMSEGSKDEYEGNMLCASMKGYCESNYNVQLICGNKRNLRISTSVNLKKGFEDSVLFIASKTFILGCKGEMRMLVHVCHFHMKKL